MHVQNVGTLTAGACSCSVRGRRSHVHNYKQGNFRPTSCSFKRALTFPSSPTSLMTLLIFGNFNKTCGSRRMKRLHRAASRSLMAGSVTLRRKSSRFSAVEPRTLAGGEKKSSRASDSAALAFIPHQSLSGRFLSESRSRTITRMPETHPKWCAPCFADSAFLS